MGEKKHFSESAPPQVVLNHTVELKYMCLHYVVGAGPPPQPPHTEYDKQKQHKTLQHDAWLQSLADVACLQRGNWRWKN